MKTTSSKVFASAQQGSETNQTNELESNSGYIILICQTRSINIKIIGQKLEENLIPMVTVKTME